MSFVLSYWLRVRGWEGEQLNKAQLVSFDTGDVFDLTRKCGLGRAEDNEITVPDRWVSRHHCVFQRSMLGAWYLIQLGQKTSGPGTAKHTTVRREGRIIYLRPMQKWRLAHGDTLAFGKPPGDETLVFSHEFRIVG